MKSKTILLNHGRTLRRVIQGKLIDDLDVDFTLPLPQLKEKLEEALLKWREDGHSFGLWNEIKLLLSEGYIVLMEGSFIEVATDEGFSLDVLTVQDHLTEYDRYVIRFSDNLFYPIHGVMPSVVYHEDDLDTAKRIKVASEISKKLSNGQCAKYVCETLNEYTMAELSQETIDSPLEVIRHDDGTLEVRNFLFEGFRSLRNAIAQDLKTLKLPIEN